MPEKSKASVTREILVSSLERLVHCGWSRRQYLPTLYPIRFGDCRQAGKPTLLRHCKKSRELFDFALWNNIISSLKQSAEGGERWMPGIRIKENESFENALRRFKKQVEKTGILSEVRKREHYEKPSIKRKKKALAAKKRAMKRMRKIMDRG